MRWTLRCLCNSTIGAGGSTAPRIAARTGGERTVQIGPKYYLSVLLPRGNFLVDIKRYPASVLQTNLGVPCVPQLAFAMHDLRTEHEAKAVRADVNKEFNWLISTTPLPCPTAALPTHNKTSLIFFVQQTYARTKVQKSSCGWGCKLG